MQLHCTKLWLSTSFILLTKSTTERLTRIIFASRKVVVRSSAVSTAIVVGFFKVHRDSQICKHVVQWHTPLSGWLKPSEMACDTLNDSHWLKLDERVRFWGNVNGSWAFRWCQDREVTAGNWEGKHYNCRSLVVRNYLFLLSSLRRRRCLPDWLSGTGGCPGGGSNTLSELPD